MIASNFRKFPEALFAQMELRLEEAAQYFQDLTPTLRAIWTRLLARREPRKEPTPPAWWTEAKNRAKALAVSVKAACLPLEPGQGEMPARGLA